MTGEGFDLPSTDNLPVVADAYGLGTVYSGRYLAEGLLNRNWRITTDKGTFALKEVVNTPVDKLRRSLAVLGELEATGLPVCAPYLSLAGEPVVTVGERSYCLLPWVEGEHRPGAELQESEATSLGVLLGRIHRGLADPALPLGEVGERPRAKVTAPEAALAEAERFLRLIAQLDTPGAFDQATERALKQRTKLIAEHAEQRPADEWPRGPWGWTHGDFQPLNLLWRHEAVAAVIDWDRLGIRPYGEEVVRTAQVQFGTAAGHLDLQLVAAFVAGYRSQQNLADEDLVDAIERLWWKRMTDYWQLQFHYDKSDFGADALWESGERLIAWWTQDRDAVRSAFLGNPAR
ncbi:phosphotransferase [Streptomyces sp. NPDC047081]|uniref:phosphotransferase n=1 Tax=Streptomyces sp. NPDC047081 TaxID=3154706 RepID=UPI0033E216B1